MSESFVNSVPPISAMMAAATSPAKSKVRAVKPKAKRPVGRPRIHPVFDESGLIVVPAHSFKPKPKRSYVRKPKPEGQEGEVKERRKYKKTEKFRLDDLITDIQVAKAVEDEEDRYRHHRETRGSSMWHDVFTPNQVVVSMDTNLFGQHIVLRHANDAFMRNFRFKDPDPEKTAAEAAAYESRVEQVEEEKQIKMEEEKKIKIRNDEKKLARMALEKEENDQKLSQFQEERKKNRLYMNKKAFAEKIGMKIETGPDTTTNTSTASSSITNSNEPSTLTSSTISSAGMKYENENDTALPISPLTNSENQLLPVLGVGGVGEAMKALPERESTSNSTSTRASAPVAGTTRTTSQAQAKDEFQITRGTALTLEEQGQGQSRIYNDDDADIERKDGDVGPAPRITYFRPTVNGVPLRGLLGLDNVKVSSMGARVKHHSARKPDIAIGE